MFPIALASFSLCGIGCYSPGFIRYEELPLAVLMCAIGGLIVFLAVQWGVTLLVDGRYQEGTTGRDVYESQEVR